MERSTTFGTAQFPVTVIASEYSKDTTCVFRPNFEIYFYNYVDVSTLGSEITGRIFTVNLYSEERT